MDQERDTSTSMKTIIIILLIVLAGGFLAYWYWWRPKEGLREITEVKVYFIKDISKRVNCICDNPVIRKIPKTKKVEKAAFGALEELLKGPTQEEWAQGYGGCLPGKGHVRGYKKWYEEMVANYKKKGKNIDSWGQKFLGPNGKFTPWEDRVKIKTVKIKDGIAYADFSKELYSYGGGSCFTEQIETSIINTLKQFPEVKEAKILVEGKVAEIEP
jgi:spore germination protein GerM